MGQILEPSAIRLFVLQPGIAPPARRRDESRLSGGSAGSRLWEEVLTNRLQSGGR